MRERTYDEAFEAMSVLALSKAIQKNCNVRLYNLEPLGGVMLQLAKLYAEKKVQDTILI